MATTLLHQPIFAYRIGHGYVHKPEVIKHDERLWPIMTTASAVALSSPEQWQQDCTFA